MPTELKAPPGLTRVVGIDLFERRHYFVDDYQSREEAFLAADNPNKSRLGKMDDVYYVYDDQGAYIRGNEAVGQEISP